MTSEIFTADDAYLSIAHQILQHGFPSDDRTGTGTTRLFGVSAAYDCQYDFPLLTSKKVFWRGVVEELLWFLRGETNIRSLQEKGVHIWDGWATDDGEIGPCYGKQWRAWSGILSNPVDQLANIIMELHARPNTRRAVISAWNPEVLPSPTISPKQNAEIGLQALPPCHTLFQFGVLPVEEGKPLLSMTMYQRSADWFLGVPFNIASYSLLLNIVAKMLDMQPFQFIHFVGDAHIYNNHVDQMILQMDRHIEDERPSPRLVLNPDQDWSLANVKNWRFEDFMLEGYNPHPAIAAPVSV